MKNKNSSRGFSVIEVVLAAAIFMLFSTSAVVVVLGGINANRLGAEETIANQFATEGIEAVKSIKNQAYTNLITPNPTPRAVLRNVNNVWEFNTTDGSSNTLTHNASDNYVRQVKVESVNRDASGNIVSTGTPDPDTKKITSTVSWNFNSARPESVVLTTYLSDWRKPIVSGGPIMMAYSKTTSNTPFYRTWGGSSWSAEGSNTQPVGGNINYVVLKSSRTRNEAILGTLDSNGNIYIQVWNGTSWSILTSIAIGSANATTRSFDIEYEKSGDKAVIVYPASPSFVDFAYHTWDGTTLSGPTTVTTPPTTGVIKWIELTQNPISTSNEIALIMLDANVDVYGMAWDGTTWDNMGTSAVWDTTAATATRKAIDVAYEQISGRAMFIWGDTTVTDQYYRIWDGSNLTANTLLDTPGSAGIANWIRLVSRPNSNELMYGVQDGHTSPDLNTSRWSGSGWFNTTEHDASTENVTSMNFDIVWETHTSNPGEAWLMWGNGAVIAVRHWNGAGWDAASVLSGSDDTSFVRLKADPNSGAIFAGIYEDSSSVAGNRDILERRLTGGGTTWSAENIIWNGGTAGTTVFFRVDIATP